MKNSVSPYTRCKHRLAPISSPFRLIWLFVVQSAPSQVLHLQSCVFVFVSRSLLMFFDPLSQTVSEHDALMLRLVILCFKGSLPAPSCARTCHVVCYLLVRSPSRMVSQQHERHKHNQVHEGVCLPILACLLQGGPGIDVFLRALWKNTLWPATLCD